MVFILFSWQKVCPSKKCFFTDDRKENCQAASTVGIQAVQFLSPEDLESHWSRYF